MSTPVQTRDSIREQLAILRIDIENTITICLNNPTNFNAQALAVDLQADHMRLLLAFVGAGGIVLAVPLARINCSMCPNQPRSTLPYVLTITSYDLTRVRKRSIHQLLHYKKYYPANAVPDSLTTTPFVPGTGIFLAIHAVRHKSGTVKHLQRLIGPPGEPGDNMSVWKWMFVDLREDENLDSIIREKGKWGWAGRFGAQQILGNGVAWGAMIDAWDPDSIFQLV